MTFLPRFIVFRVLTRVVQVELTHGKGSWAGLAGVEMRLADVVADGHLLALGKGVPHRRIESG